MPNIWLHISKMVIKKKCLDICWKLPSLVEETSRFQKEFLGGIGNSDKCMVRTQHEISDTSTVIIDSFTLSFDLSQHRRRDQNIASTFAESSSKLRWRHTKWNLLFLFSSFLHYVSSLRKKTFWVGRQRRATRRYSPALPQSTAHTLN